ncbi:MAG TPA: 23S rRNA pseudouridylate synthase B, partial [Noviherbaspirillum sp.]|nr:23S rRNA pseudouridylate synthase B [Noviherbaspirillum sp.]
MTDSATPVEAPQIEENSNAEGTADGQPKKKPGKRGVRGPRSLRRARADRPDGAEAGQATADGGAERRQAEAPAPAQAKRQGNERRKQKAAAQNQRGKQAGQPAGARQPGRKAVNPDDVFAFVTSDTFDTVAADDGKDRNSRAKNVRRDLTAEDDAPKLHKVLAEAGLGSRRDMEE